MRCYRIIFISMNTLLSKLCRAASTDLWFRHTATPNQDFQFLRLTVTVIFTGNTQPIHNQLQNWYLQLKCRDYGVLPSSPPNENEPSLLRKKDVE